MEQTIFEKVSTLAVEWFPVVASFVGSFALLATQTPNKTDNKIMQVILDLVNFFGANINKASNKE